MIGIICENYKSYLFCLVGAATKMSVYQSIILKRGYFFSFNYIVTDALDNIH